jgi:hypothetical protein
MPDDFVDNEEILYRRVPAGRRLYNYRTDGTIKISSMAFTDREFRVSVDRAKLCKNNPSFTKGDEPGGVVSLVARDIRSINELTRNDPKGKPIQQFKIEVESAPLQNNSAHAEIYAIPEFTNADEQGAFHRLCRRLARLAEARQWEILPPPDNQ